MVPLRASLFCLTAALALAGAGRVAAQDDELRSWAVGAARGAFDLCRSDAPDAGQVADHGQIWGWPRFVPYLEHPRGYQREAGGESRRSQTVRDKTANVGLGVQSGRVTSAAPANIRYFRCNLDADQPIEDDLVKYFTEIYGPPISRSDQGAVWLIGKGTQPAPEDAASEEFALKALLAAPVGSSMLRIELSRERGLDRAKLSLFRSEPAA